MWRKVFKILKKAAEVQPLLKSPEQEIVGDLLSYVLQMSLKESHAIIEMMIDIKIVNEDAQDLVDVLSDRFAIHY